MCSAWWLRRASWLAFGCVLLAVTATHAEPPKVKIFLLAGQSNMFGKGEVEELSQRWQTPQDDVWIWQDDRRSHQGWTALRPGFGNTDSNLGSAGDNLRFDDPDRPHRFGPEVSIGRTLADAFPDSRIAFIKHAIGGTDVWSDWNPTWDPSRDGDYNNRAMYNGLSVKLADGIAELNRLGLEWELAGVFWSQGGRDARVREKAEAYEANLRRMIDAMRDDFNAPSLPFILARQELNPRTTPHAKFVRAAHEAIAASDPYVAIIQTEDIADTSSTDAHWNAQGQLDVGRRYADKYLRLIQAASTRSLVWTPNDPEFRRQSSFHNDGQTGGIVDADIDALEAWEITTGSMQTLAAVMDDGVDYTHPDLYLNIWLNESEIPAEIKQHLSDVDNDGLLTFRDLNAPANSIHARDINQNGYIDGGDLLADPNWENGVDEDGNGLIDDLVGWDCYDDDNDPFVPGASRHGTATARYIGGIGNNGIGGAGLNWKIRMIPIRVRGDGVNRVVSDVVDAFDYAIVAGASIVDAGYRGSPNKPDDPAKTASEFSQDVYDALERTRQAGLLVVAAAGNGARNTDIQPWYPQSYDVDNVVTVAALNGTDNQLELSGITNWGPSTVDLAVTTTNGTTSHALAVTTGVAALIKSRHPDWSYRKIKDQIMQTVDPEPSLAGKTVSGGRLNAARALGFVLEESVFFSCFANLGGPIELPDADPRHSRAIDSEIHIKAGGTILDLEIRVNIEHPRVQDLRIELVAPDGSATPLYVGRDQEDDVVNKFLDELLDRVRNDDFNMTVFDDDADHSIDDGIAPYDGFYRPHAELGRLDNMQLAGVWKLRITDRTPTNIGRLLEWAIFARYTK